MRSLINRHRKQITALSCFVFCASFLICLLLFVIVPLHSRANVSKPISLPSVFSTSRNTRAMTVTNDDVFKKIYNNPAATKIKYDKYSNDILAKEKSNIETVTNFTKNTKRIIETNNLFYQNGCVYRINDTYLHQNKQYKMQRNQEVWIQTGHFLGVPAVYRQVSSNRVFYNKKYKIWENDLKNNVPQRFASLNVSLPASNYNYLFKNDANLKNIIDTRHGTLSVVFNNLKSYDISTFLYGLHNQDLTGKYVHRPSLFLKDYLRTPKIYNNSILRVSPPLDSQPGLNSLGYTYIVCLNNRYYIYQYAVDHLKFHKKTTSFNEAPISLFADLPAKSITKNVANYLQGLLFDSFGPNYPLSQPTTPDSTSLTAQHINHYASHIFNYLSQKPSYYMLLPSTTTKIDHYQNVTTNLDFPQDTKFKVFMAGGKANKQKFSLKKRPWELNIAGVTKVISINKSKGYKNERRSQFDYCWNLKSGSSFTRSFYYFAYLLAIECGQCFASVSSPSQDERYDFNRSYKSSLSPWNTDTQDHGYSISLYLLFSLTFGVAVDQNMNADTHLVIHNDYSFPTYNPDNGFLPQFYKSKINFSLAFLITILILICIFLFVLFTILIFTKNKERKLNYQKLNISDDLKKIKTKK